MKRQRLIVLLSIVATAMSALLAFGCSPQRDTAPPHRSTVYSFNTEPWTSERDGDGVILRTEHYAIYTTITDPHYRNALTHVMEDAYRRYQALAPSTVDLKTPLECYVFARRSEWESFTTRLTPSDAPTYFRINRGGYTVGDRMAVFSSGQSATLRSAAHEGWHQYAARHLVDRLPPFLEEGIACFFENVQIDERGRPVWELTENHNRSRALRMATETGQLFPLAQLITLHAGEVVEMPGGRVEAFYAQSWAFARFLWDGDNGRYRPAMQRLLGDSIAGKLTEPTSTTATTRPGNVWDSRSAAPLLERYLSEDLPEIDRAYQQFVAQLIDRDARRRSGDE